MSTADGFESDPLAVYGGDYQVDDVTKLLSLTAIGALRCTVAHLNKLSLSTVVGDAESVMRRFVVLYLAARVSAYALAALIAKAQGLPVPQLADIEGNFFCRFVPDDAGASAQASRAAVQLSNEQRPQVSDDDSEWAGTLLVAAGNNDIAGARELWLSGWDAPRSYRIMALLMLMGTIWRSHSGQDCAVAKMPLDCAECAAEFVGGPDRDGGLGGYVGFDTVAARGRAAGWLVPDNPHHHAYCPAHR